MDGPRTAGVIAVILKGYPRLSETFIAQELHALEARGVALALFSLRHPTDRETHPIHAAIRAPVCLPARVPASRAGARLARLARAPAAFPDTALRSPPGGATSGATRRASRLRRFGQALVLAAELPRDVVAPARALPAHAGLGDAVRGDPARPARGAVRRTPRTSGRRPNGRSAKSSPPVPGRPPARRSTPAICAASPARTVRSI